MSAYAATARIERVAPRLVIGRTADDAADVRMVAAVEPGDLVADVAAVDIRDPLVERLVAARDRWSQLTFYLFDAESWR